MIWITKDLLIIKMLEVLEKIEYNIYITERYKYKGYPSLEQRESIKLEQTE